MELEHSFTVPVPRERAWDVLLDIERVAPCMPGASLDSVDGDEIHGKIKVKVGPISMTYAGTAKIVERDEAAGVVRLDASGKETKGAGTASASVRSLLEDRGNETQVRVLTTLNVTGKPAQFGRGVMNEVSGKLLEIFAANLATMLGQADKPAASAPAAAAGGATLDDLGLPTRVVASLRREGITTVEQLAGKSEHDLLAVDGIGPASVEDIKSQLAARGLSGQPDTPASRAASNGGAMTHSAANGSATASNGSRTGATATTSTTATTSSEPHSQVHNAAHIEADSLNLIKVAGMPVLKRSLPVIAGGVSLVLIFGLRRKLRKRGDSGK
jgi:carbon monoxide dehydrogenase subunit G